MFTITTGAGISVNINMVLHVAAILVGVGSSSH